MTRVLMSFKTFNASLIRFARTFRLRKHKRIRVRIQDIQPTRGSTSEADTTRKVDVINGEFIDNLAIFLLAISDCKL
ncbi:hypothetical protein [Paenibacillus xylanexedens]|uniref:hypothetical protein n=1 Tax=Paenibacillus xylanexedens TaxID=528191 RepID=UPI00164311D7|nr:hypothetical protein [Paenibacillus xylanexedens]